ncbi:MAG: hypothetical protein HZA90_22760 [Verrucomicrobia bacterium]|nr:hypothetical protein [Verrucomicrobiota bacterium]
MKTQPSVLASTLLVLGLALADLIRPARTAWAQAPAPSGTVITIAGNGSRGFSGDGGPATNATMSQATGLAIGPDGTLYFADYSNFRIRAVDPSTGLIRTIAGNGNIGDTGNGGPATNATLAGVFGMAVDRTRNALYFVDYDNNWVRRVNLANGLLDVYAGLGLFDGVGFEGDDGPATAAKLGFPEDVATDGTGRLAICDPINFRIRQVNPVSGLITTLAGNGTAAPAGDGGSATNASFYNLYCVAADSAGNVFLRDGPPCGNECQFVVRRVDAATGLIHTIAGGGTNAPGTGLATHMNFDNIVDLAADADGNLFIATPVRVFKLDLATGLLAPFAGDGIGGEFNGDGGPALDAKLNIGGVAVAPGGGLVIADPPRIRYVVPDSINLTNDSGQTAFHLPWVSALAGDLTIANNPNLTNVSAGSLTSVGGVVSVGGNTAAGGVDLGALGSAGSVSITGNTAASTVSLGSLSSVTGDVTIDDNASAGVVDLGSLTNVGGVVNVGGNTAAGSVDLGALGSVGSVSITGNTAAITVSLGSLSSVTGDVTIDDNASAGVVDLGSLTNVGGVVSVGGNTAAGSVDLSALGSAGNVSITGNTAAITVSLGSLSSVTGDVTIDDNAPDAVVDLSSLTSFGCGSNEVTMTLNGGTVEMTNGLTLCTNATLTGSTTIDGSVTNNGTISPGASPGRLNLTGHLVLANPSRLRLEIGGYAPNQFDVLHVAGSVTLGGTLSVSLTNSFPSVMTNGANFTVLTAGSPLTGAFANVASGGSLTTTDGYARFTVLYAGASTLRLTDLMIVDTDHDGLPDWWEDQSGLSKTNAADATLDFDGDGASNADEFRAGTNPNNPASVFRIVAVEREADDLRLTWTTVGGKSYVVQTSGSFTNNFADFSPLITSPGMTESVTNFLDPGGTSNRLRYYRVRLEPWPVTPNRNDPP